MTFDAIYINQIADLAGIDAGEVRPPSSVQLIVGRTRLHLLDWGPAAAPPIVLLHAGGLSARSWDPICAALSQEWRCIALDQRGHGDSEWSPECDYSIEAHESDLLGIIDQLGLAPPVLIGASMGGANALHFAGRRRVHALVLVDAGPRVPVAEARRIAERATALPSRPNSDDFLPRSWSPTASKAEFVRASVMNGIRRRPDGTWMSKADTRQQEDAAAFLTRISDRERLLWEAARNVVCPTLLVRGGRSRIMSEEQANELADAIAGDVTQATLPASGHLVHRDDPAGLISAVRDFLHFEAGSPQPPGRPDAAEGAAAGQW